MLKTLVIANQESRAGALIFKWLMLVLLIVVMVLLIASGSDGLEVLLMLLFILWAARDFFEFDLGDMWDGLTQPGTISVSDRLCLQRVTGTRYYKPEAVMQVTYNRNQGALEIGTSDKKTWHLVTIEHDVGALKDAFSRFGLHCIQEDSGHLTMCRHPEAFLQAHDEKDQAQEQLNVLELESSGKLGVGGFLFYVASYSFYTVILWTLLMEFDHIVIRVGIGLVLLWLLRSAFGTFWHGFGGKNRPTAMRLIHQQLLLTSAWWKTSYPVEDILNIEFDDDILTISTVDGRDWIFMSMPYKKEQLKAFFLSLGLVCEEDKLKYLRMAHP